MCGKDEKIRLPSKYDKRYRKALILCLCHFNVPNLSTHLSCTTIFVLKEAVEYFLALTRSARSLNRYTIIAQLALDKLEIINDQLTDNFYLNFTYARQKVP